MYFIIKFKNVYKNIIKIKKIKKRENKKRKNKEYIG